MFGQRDIAKEKKRNKKEMKKVNVWKSNTNSKDFRKKKKTSTCGFSSSKKQEKNVVINHTLSEMSHFK